MMQLSCTADIGVIRRPVVLSDDFINADRSQLAWNRQAPRSVPPVYPITPWCVCTRNPKTTIISIVAHLPPSSTPNPSLNTYCIYYNFFLVVLHFTVKLAFCRVTMLAPPYVQRVSRQQCWLRCFDKNKSDLADLRSTENR